MENLVLTEKTLAQQRLDSCQKHTRPDIAKRNCIRNIHPCTPSLSPLPSAHRASLATSLTHICSKWREIALSTPVLWWAIPLFITGVPVERQTHILDLWLKKPGSWLLIIGNDEEDNAQDSSELVASFMPCRARWEYLKIITSTSHLSAFEGEIPVLRHLDLELYGGSKTDAQPGSLRIAPLLLR
jgi:hypothetical protein